MTKWNGSCSISINYLQGLKTSRVEALAEIFDFVAGLVQRVPKKTSIAKSDLQNSTARLWNLEGSATGVNMSACCRTATPELRECSIEFNGSRLLPLRCSCRD